MYFLLKNCSLLESVHPFIKRNKTKFYLRNTNNTDRNGVNKQNTHTKYLDNIGKGGATEASNNVNTFLNLRFIFFFFFPFLSQQNTSSN